MRIIVLFVGFNSWRWLVKVVMIITAHESVGVSLNTLETRQFHSTNMREQPPWDVDKPQGDAVQMRISTYGRKVTLTI